MQTRRQTANQRWLVRMEIRRRQYLASRHKKFPRCRHRFFYFFRQRSGNSNHRPILIGLDVESAAQFADPCLHASEADAASLAGSESLQ